MFRAIQSTRGLAVLSKQQQNYQVVNQFALTACRALATNEGGTGYIKRQQKLGRPVSPHVTIYAFPLAAISSVTHRLTGGMLTIGLYGLGYYALVGGDVAGLASSLGASSIGPILKFAVVTPLVFHFGVGVRHWYWDKYPEGLNSETQYQSAVIIFGISGATGLISMFL